MASKAEVWRERLAACRSSGLSTAAFCRERGLSYARYMYWQQRLGSRPTGLVPVVVAESAVAAKELSLEVTLPGAVSLRVHGAAVADVVALVRGLVC